MNPSDIQHLVSISGIIIRCSELIPDITNATFKCTNDKCGVMQQVQLSAWVVQEPTYCDTCKKNHTFELQHNSCNFGDKQLIKLQETPESVPEGETPQTVVLNCYDDLVDCARPGDRVNICGIFRANAVRYNPRWNHMKSVFRTHLDAISLVKHATDGESVDETAQEVGEEVTPLSKEKDLDPNVVGGANAAWNRKIRDLAK